MGYGGANLSRGAMKRSKEKKYSVETELITRPSQDDRIVGILE